MTKEEFKERIKKFTAVLSGTLRLKNEAGIARAFTVYSALTVQNQSILLMKFINHHSPYINR